MILAIISYYCVKYTYNSTIFYTLEKLFFLDTLATTTYSEYTTFSETDLNEYAYTRLSRAVISIETCCFEIACKRGCFFFLSFTK